MVAMPTGTGDGLLICRLSELKEVVNGLLDNWKLREEQDDIQQ